jgi:RimJ/RimL family protein N-acetyltransferase
MEEMINMFGKDGVHRPKLLFPNEKFNYNGLFSNGLELFDYMDRDAVLSGLLDLFSNPNVCQYNQEKARSTLDQIERDWRVALGEQMSSRIYNYHIINSRFNKYIGIIHNISYLGIKEYFPGLLDHVGNIEKSWLLEFYSIPEAWGVNLMPHMVTEMLKIHVEQGYTEFYTLVNPENDRCLKFLVKLGFRLYKFENERGKGMYLDEHNRVLYRLVIQ